MRRAFGLSGSYLSIAIFYMPEAEAHRGGIQQQLPCDHNAGNRQAFPSATPPARSCVPVYEFHSGISRGNGKAAGGPDTHGPMRIEKAMTAEQISDLLCLAGFIMGKDEAGKVVWKCRNAPSCP